MLIQILIGTSCLFGSWKVCLMASWAGPKAAINTHTLPNVGQDRQASLFSFKCSFVKCIWRALIWKKIMNACPVQRIPREPKEKRKRCAGQKKKTGTPARFSFLSFGHRNPFHFIIQHTLIKEEIKSVLDWRWNESFPSQRSNIYKKKNENVHNLIFLISSWLWTLVFIFFFMFDQKLWKEREIVN